MQVGSGQIEIIYTDGSTQRNVPLQTGWIEGYDKNKVGTQELKVTYEGHTTSFSLVLSPIKVSPQRVATLRNNGSKATTDSIHIMNKGSHSDTRIGMAQFSMTEEMKRALQQGAKATLKYTAVCEKTATKSYNYIQFYGTKEEVSKAGWSEMTYRGAPAVTAIKFASKDTACRHLDRATYLSKVGSKYSGTIDVTEYVKSKISGDTVTFRFNLSDHDLYLMEGVEDLQLVIE